MTVQGFRNPIVLLALLLVVSVIALISSAVLGLDKGVLSSMANAEYARGLITFLFTVVTIGTALVLVVSALVGSNDAAADKRFQNGKEVFSLLLGVFGTVVGYYYGSTHQGSAGSELKISDLVVAPEAPHPGERIRVRALASGGIQPYTYVLRTGGESKQNVERTANGDLIIADIVTPVSALGDDLLLQLTVTDAMGHEVSGHTEIRFAARP